MREDWMMDMRLTRTRQITALIMEVMNKYIRDDHDSRCKAYEELSDLLHKNGAEIVSDADRHQAGLAARSPQGWTAAELQILEAKRMELMLKPMAPIIPC